MSRSIWGKQSEATKSAQHRWRRVKLLEMAYKMVVTPAIMSGLEAIVLTKIETNKLNVTELKMLRFHLEWPEWMRLKLSISEGQQFLGWDRIFGPDQSHLRKTLVACIIYHVINSGFLLVKLNIWTEVKYSFSFIFSFCFSQFFF